MLWTIFVILLVLWLLGLVTHDGRVHPHLIGFGDCCRPDPCPPGPKADCLIAEVNK